MMFNKDNTNTGGECLCKSCVFGVPMPDNKYSCLMDYDKHINVGVCRDYQYYDESEAFNG